MRVDAVVSDIDGVLIDTSESYQRAILESVRTVYGETIARDEIQAIKDAGGFNNDWVTTDAVALFVLASREGYAESVATFADRIRRNGGGLDGARAVIDAAFGGRTSQRILDGWDPAALRRTFQWLYLGPDRYDELEERPPPEEQPEPAGFMDDEPILVDAATKSAIRESYEVGILTGRPREEAEIALSRLGCAPATDHVVTMDDWNGGKPDPDALVDIAAACGAASIVYVGDELDDIRTAVNADRADPDRSYRGIGVLTGGLAGETGRAALVEAGAAGVLETINDLPAWLESER